MTKTSLVTRFVAMLFAIMLLVSSLTIVVSDGGVQVTSPAPTEPTQPIATDITEMPTESTVTEPPLKDKPILYDSLMYLPTESIEEAECLKENVLVAIDTLKNEMLSGEYTDTACFSMSLEVDRLSSIVYEIDSHIENLRLWYSRYEEYLYATRLWRYLKEHGYSDVVCAGILGNFMTETGGHTLALRPHIYDSTGVYYGLAQWSGKYHAEVRDKDFEYQCEYLIKTMEKEFNVFGYKYKRGFDYEDFLKMESPKEAALAFAKCYERCSSVSYTKRQNGAVTAYDYFT